MKYNLLIVCLLAAACASPHAANPIVPARGLNDPHIHIFGDRAYVFASHDRSATNKTFWPVCQHLHHERNLRK